ncbi:DUF4468 domain-containing protein [Galbibacter sp. BG1]|uniref:DUF4468 domain-containing protein n=1 Tax=Galbibacter sp. BG1 TaxID=1170699 RepID=UPI0015B926BC|nr:DUF4468 domain-containing protein [Galbibacter sp. BG1]QLE00710.1 DUF4468 domain-containing protein [Galbibacter sp. BG1]
MRKILLFMLFIASIGYSQQFKYNEEGVINQEVIREVPYSINEIEQRVSNWVQFNYKNPNLVTTGNVENEFLRFNGMVDYGVENVGMGVLAPFKLFYTFRTDFKDGKYKLTLEQANFTYDSNGVISKQKVKGGRKLKDAYAKFYDNVIIDLNSIEKSLFDYVSGNKELTSDDW